MSEESVVSDGEGGRKSEASCYALFARSGTDIRDATQTFQYLRNVLAKKVLKESYNKNTS